MGRKSISHLFAKIHNSLLMGIPNTMDIDPYEAFVERHRIDSDGKGISTLVIMDACHLNCKYCPNRSYINTCTPYFEDHQLYHNLGDMYRRTYTFDDDFVLDEVKIDELYFSMTGGGVVFGGGEPLLFIDGIKTFKKKCPNWWELRVETSLNVKTKDVETGIDLFDQWIVDVKTLNPDIYRAYTGFSNSCLHKNLRLLASKGIQDKVLIRLPLIPGFNNEVDIEESKSKLTALGYSNFDVFEYQIEIPKNKVDGDAKCEYLRNIRRKAAIIAGVEYNPIQCKKGQAGGNNSCNGHCLGCDYELKMLTKAYKRKMNQV